MLVYRHAKHLQRSWPIVIAQCRLESSLQVEKSAAKLKALANEPSRSDKLKIYALYKQATVGDVTTPQPSSWDVVSKMKWSAWKELEHMEPSVAGNRYVELVEQLTQQQPNGTKQQQQQQQPNPKTATTLAATSEHEGLAVSKKEGSLIIRLDNAASLNSLTLVMLRKMTELINQAAADDTVYHLILAGTGDYFSTGNNLKDFSEGVRPGKNVDEAVKDGVAIFKAFMASLIDFPKPAIGLVNGPAIGAGCSMLGLLDIVYASDSATFNLPFTGIGITPEGASTYMLPRVIGWPRAAEMLLMGATLNANEAKAAGLVSDVFPRAEFESQTAERLRLFRNLQPKSLIYTKGLMRSPIKDTLHKANGDECTRLLERLASEEFLAILNNYISKKGRKLRDV